MAKKLVLIPMELYRGLLSPRQPQNDEDLTERAPMLYEKSLLKKVKKKARNDLSARNVLYNQQLRRFLRARKEAKNKPLKVQFSDDAQNVKVFKAGTTPSEPLKVAAIDEDGELQHVKIEEKAPSVQFSEGFEQYETPDENNRRKSYSRRTVSSSTYTNSDVKSIPESMTAISPIGPKRRAARVESEARKQAKLDKANHLMEIINAKPEKFGVKAGKIINPSTGKAVKDSDLNWAVSRLVSPSLENAYSPPGMKILQKALFADEQTKKLLHGSYQKGEGIGIKLDKTILFRPAKWKK